MQMQYLSDEEKGRDRQSHASASPGLSLDSEFEISHQMAPGFMKSMTMIQPCVPR